LTSSRPPNSKQNDSAVRIIGVSQTARISAEPPRQNECVQGSFEQSRAWRQPPSVDPAAVAAHAVAARARQVW
ncbi:MAG TPA: hypothetical protein VKH44_15170, partial [Pirellulaceae bacterium]|nr:hypothetical protein [Pirellulaceae bacterium]